MAALQTFGSLLDPHPHVHLLVTWGVFAADGTFHQPLVGQEVACEALNLALRKRILDLLVKEGAIGVEVVENMMSWGHSGFGTYVGQTVDVHEDREGRPVVPEARGTRRRNRPEPEDKSGWGPPLTVAPGEPRKDRESRSRRSWARLIQFVYEVDPLVCPRCRGAMRIVACINEVRVVVRILDHLGLRSGPDPPRAGPSKAPAAELTREPNLDDFQYTGLDLN